MAVWLASRGDFVRKILKEFLHLQAAQQSSLGLALRSFFKI
jgi:hypothetical protein